MTLGLIRGVGEAVALEGCLEVYPDPSFPRKPIAGKGSLEIEGWSASGD